MPKKSSAQSQRATPDIRAILLEAALPDIAFDGWQDSVLEAACTKTGIDIDTADRALPGGMADLALYFSKWADDKMLAALAKHDMENMRIRDRIALGVRTRLEILSPWKQAVSAASPALGLSARSFRIPKAIWQTADKIWIAAGDTSTDYNHYTKRFLLSGVLTTTTLFWLSDDSDLHGETWAFLDRRIDNVLKIGRSLGGIGDKLRAAVPRRKKKT